ncbi:hypothetical protein ACOMHN_012848 [Nucella lapillus]
MMVFLSYEEKGEDRKRYRLFPSYRLVISLLSFCGLFLSAQSQTTMGAAIVCMVTNNSHDNNNNNSSSNNNINTFEIFDCGKTIQGWILGTRFLAYYLGQLPSGYLTTYLSNRVMAALGLVVMGTFDVLAVPCARHSVGLLIVLVQGFANAFVTTGCYDILGKWIPTHESSVLLGFAGIGNLVPAACCLVLVLLPGAQDVAEAVVAYSMCLVAFTCTLSGWVANVSDLAPQQGGATLALCQTAAAWVSFCVPVIMDYITVQTAAAWVSFCVPVIVDYITVQALKPFMDLRAVP